MEKLLVSRQRDETYWFVHEHRWLIEVHRSTVTANEGSVRPDTLFKGGHMSLFNIDGTRQNIPRGSCAVQ